MGKIRGIIPPMVTPLLEQDRIDKEGTRNLVERLIKGKVGGIFILGTTGEAQSLSYKLRYEFIELVCSIVAGRVPVLVGITDTSMKESVRLAEVARKNGAAGVVAASPYYFEVSQAELIEYITALADSLPLPLYLYNMPSCVKVMLEVPTVLKLSSHQNIAGLKDSSANMTYFENLLHYLGGKDDFSLYVGPEEMTGACVLMGADGGINGGANIFPELYVSMFDAASSGDIAKVRELQERIMDVSTSLYTIGKYGSKVIKGIKCSLSLMGVCNGYLALPYREFEPSERVLIRKALQKLGVSDLR